MIDEPGSPRRAELLDSAYAYVVEHGLATLSLRPLAKATATSPRVLLYLFGSKDGLVAEILARARRSQLDLVAGLVADGRPRSLDEVVEQLWDWASVPERRGALKLFFTAYGLSLEGEPGPWAGFAEQSLAEWLPVLVGVQRGVPPAEAAIRATRALALLRGLLLQLVAGGDPAVLRAALTC